MSRDWSGLVLTPTPQKSHHLPVYSGTEAGEDALLPLSHSRSRLPGRRLGDMRPDGDGALRGRWDGRGVRSVVNEVSMQ